MSLSACSPSVVWPRRTCASSWKAVLNGSAATGDTEIERCRAKPWQLPSSRSNGTSVMPSAAQCSRAVPRR